jgi:uncharacterized membrane protein YsdA (DUF1294 family)
VTPKVERFVIMAVRCQNYENQNRRITESNLGGKGGDWKAQNLFHSGVSG